MKTVKVVLMGLVAMLVLGFLVVPALADERHHAVWDRYWEGQMNNNYGGYGNYGGYYDSGRPYGYYDGRYRNSYYDYGRRGGWVSIISGILRPRVVVQPSVVVIQPVVQPSPVVEPQRMVQSPPVVAQAPPVVQPPPAPPVVEKKQTEGDLLLQLQSSDEGKREDAAKKLAKFPTVPVVVALQQTLLTDPEKDVREEAAKSLGKMKTQMALPTLEFAAANDKEEDVREEATKSLNKIKAEVANQIKQQQQDNQRR